MHVLGGNHRNQFSRSRETGAFCQAVGCRSHLTPLQDVERDKLEGPVVSKFGVTMAHQVFHVVLQRYVRQTIVILVASDTIRIEYRKSCREESRIRILVERFADVGHQDGSGLRWTSLR